MFHHHVSINPETAAVRSGAKAAFEVLSRLTPEYRKEFLGDGLLSLVHEFWPSRSQIGAPHARVGKFVKMLSDGEIAITLVEGTAASRTPNGTAAREVVPFILIELPENEQLPGYQRKNPTSRTVFHWEAAATFQRPKSSFTWTYSAENDPDSSRRETCLRYSEAEAEARNHGRPETETKWDFPYYPGMEWLLAFEGPGSGESGTIRGHIPVFIQKRQGPNGATDEQIQQCSPVATQNSPPLQHLRLTYPHHQSVFKVFPTHAPPVDHQEISTLPSGLPLQGIYHQNEPHPANDRLFNPRAIPLPPPPANSGIVLQSNVPPDVNVFSQTTNPRAPYQQGWTTGPAIYHSSNEEDQHAVGKVLRSTRGAWRRYKSKRDLARQLFNSP